MAPLMLGGAIMLLAFALPAEAAGKLVLYCSTNEAWCRLIANEFTRQTAVDVAMRRESTGEIYAQILSERHSPKGDVWWGGTGDPHLQAAEEGLTAPYRSTRMAELRPWAIAQHDLSGGRSVGIYTGVLGFGYNIDLLAQSGLEAPVCWQDLIRPEFKGKVRMANPNSSGTAYTMLATMVQLLGEERGIAWMKALHKNIDYYTRTGSAPIKAVADGEVLAAIAFQQDAVAQAVAGRPIATVSPCEGTGQEIGSMSIIAGAPNPKEARQFYEFALRADIQNLADTVGAYQVPANKGAWPPGEAPSLRHVKLIAYDFKTYGSSAMRNHLLSRWNTEVTRIGAH